VVPRYSVLRVDRTFPAPHDVGVVKPLDRGLRRLARDLVIVVFGVISLRYLIPPLVGGLPFGWDAVVYTHAARALLDGGDPWLARGYAIGFAAPPPSLIPFLPFAWMSDAAVSISWVAIAAASAVYSVRRLGLAWWWLAFPPITLGVAAGSGALLGLALMAYGSTTANAAAVAIRIYSALPLALLGHWRSAAASVLLLAVSAPFLDWPAYIAGRDRVAATFQGGAANLSAFAAPALVPLAVVCLLLMGRTRAAWLIVPVLWPWTQPYYAVIALPVLVSMPWVAFTLAIPIPGLIVAGLAAQLMADRFPTRTTPSEKSTDDHWRAPGEVVVEKVKSLKLGHGYDALSGEYGDLFKKGIVDAAKVTRSALQNAASIAAMVLTTETLITDIPEKKDTAGAGGGRSLSAIDHGTPGKSSSLRSVVGALPPMTGWSVSVHRLDVIHMALRVVLNLIGSSKRLGSRSLVNRRE
jgi:TCP-1/cpn60 chaperonin family